MVHRRDGVVTTRRSWLLSLLAVGAFLARLPWGGLDVARTDPRSLGAVLRWLVDHEALVSFAGLALEFVLVWTLVFLVVPALYPSRARELTGRPSFRVAIAGLTTVTAVVVVLVMSGGVAPAWLLTLAGAAFVVTVVVTSRTDNWQFDTPYVSPTFAVVSSFVPTDRVGEFAALFRSGTVDPLARVAFQSVLGAVTAGFVLVMGALAALPILAYPALELLVLAGLGAAACRRLLPALPTAWRVRYTRTTRRMRRQFWTVRRLLTDLRGATATLLVTAGLLLGTSAVVLAVAVGASAARRTPPLADVSTAPVGLLAEWFVAGVLVCYAASVVAFWTRSARWLPAFVARDQRRRKTTVEPGRKLTDVDTTRSRVRRPVGLLVPQTLSLVGALLVLYPEGLPGSNPVPAVVVAVCGLGGATATTRYDGSVTARWPLPGIPDRFVLPASFTVQWVGTSLALVVLPGTGLSSMGPVTVTVLAVALGGYFVVDLRDELARHGRRGADVAYLVVLVVAAMLLIWVAEGPIRRLLFG